MLTKWENVTFLSKKNQSLSSLTFELNQEGCGFGSLASVSLSLELLTNPLPGLCYCHQLKFFSHESTFNLENKLVIGRTMPSCNIICESQSIFCGLCYVLGSVCSNKRELQSRVQSYGEHLTVICAFLVFCPFLLNIYFPSFSLFCWIAKGCHYLNSTHFRWETSFKKIQTQDQMWKCYCTSDSLRQFYSECQHSYFI